MKTPINPTLYIISGLSLIVLPALAGLLEEACIGG